MRDIPPTWIYFAERPNGDIKIGCTRKDRLTKRLGELWRKHGSIRLVGIMEGDYHLERALHKQFEAHCQTVTYRVGEHRFNVWTSTPTEFFSPVDEIKEYIRKNSVDLTPFRANVHFNRRHDYFGEVAP